MRKWRIEDSEELYNITGWGVNYFKINDKGNVAVTPGKVENESEIDLKKLLDELQIRDVSTPLLLRFTDILKNRIVTISECFKKAGKEYGYNGNNYIVYPIKVNQMRPVVEDIVKHGEVYNIGLEAGSKPELHAVLAFADNPDAFIICNGYKDEEFIELALLAQKMGRHVFLVVEKLNELRLIINIANRLKVKPNIGIRIKLATSGSGKWEESGGDNSKFGLNANELLEAVKLLKDKNMEDILKLIHFHLGSQITKIRKIKNALREASQFYVELKKLGFNVEFVDIGGGLGVDYDGSKSSSQSVNYSIQEYANDAVANIVDVCEKNDLPHPNIITESGRSLTAHHSVLIFDVLETTAPPYTDEIEVTDNDNELIIELHSIYNNLTKARMLEAWHDAQQIKDEVLDLFSLGIVDLETRGKMELLFWTIAYEIKELSKGMKHLPHEFRDLNKLLSHKYFCNFSLFQSLPDSWAIDQVFPIIPIQRLNEKPDRFATIQDITCDSDGKITNFVGSGDLSFSLPVHKIKKGDKYYLGVFLVGAYQEILGDLHNLFGDTNVVHVNQTEDGYEIKQIIDGETVSDVLSYVQYYPKRLVRIIEKWVTQSVHEGKITPAEGKEFLAIYRSGLYGYTYLT